MQISVTNQEKQYRIKHINISNKTNKEENKESNKWKN